MAGRLYNARLIALLPDSRTESAAVKATPMLAVRIGPMMDASSNRSELRMSLRGKTLFISGASRGIGLAIAVRAAKDGANIAIAAKSDQPNPRLPGTIHTAAEAIEAAGGKALPMQVDIRDENAVAEAVKKTAEHFGSVDILVNNASAISLTSTLDTPMKRFDLMFGVNVRGTFVCSQACTSLSQGVGEGRPQSSHSRICRRR